MPAPNQTEATPRSVLGESGAAWREIWSLAVQALRGNKLRAVLTTLGVVIGSACIVLVVTVALAGKRYIIGQIEGVGANLVYAELVRSGSAPTALGDEMTPADLQAVAQDIPQVVAVAGSHEIPMTVSLSGIERPVSLVGVTEGFQQIRRLLILRGRYFDPDDFQTRSKVCLLTQDLADLEFPHENPVGQQLHVQDLTFTTIGTFRERVATFGKSEIQKDTVLVPFPLVKDYTGADTIRTLYAQAAHPEDVAGVTTDVKRVLQDRHRTGVEYDVENLSSLLEAARKISLALSIVLLVIAFIALLISGIGIMNIMLVTVTERTREIGIRKAIGARRREILFQFLAEAVIISGGGALFGILIGVSIPLMAEAFLPGNVSLPLSWMSVVLALGVSCATGIIFGYLPATRAAGLQPTESLRYE